jgi:exodeoxyribonuclease-5
MEASPALCPDFMDSFGGVCYETLTTVVRQAGESGILHNATILRKLISEAASGELFDNIKLELDGYKDILRIDGCELIDAISDSYSSFGEDAVTVLRRSNKRAIRYNSGIRSMVQYKEERLVRGDKLMIVKNCYQFLDELEGIDYIANGDIASLLKINAYEERYGLDFAEATLSFPDYDDAVVKAKVCLNTLESESASLTYEQQNLLYQGVSEDYSHIKGKKRRYEAVREDKYFNALQLKYANAITAHKSQGGQWDCVFIDCPFWQSELTSDDLKWLYTALTRAVKKVYLVNFPNSFFK